MCKVGFSGDPLPRVITPSVVARACFPQEEMWEMGLKSCYVGTEAQEKRGILTMNYPIERGVGTDWKDMETIWDHMHAL